MKHGGTNQKTIMIHDALYMTNADFYDIGTTIFSFGCRKVSFGSQKKNFGTQKVTSGYLESTLSADFGAWEGPKSGFIKVPHHFWVILERPK